jgi:hypothetical protein
VRNVGAALQAAMASQDKDAVAVPTIVTMATASQSAAGTAEMAAVVERMLNVFCEGFVHLTRGMQGKRAADRYI